MTATPRPIPSTLSLDQSPCNSHGNQHNYLVCGPGSERLNHLPEFTQQTYYTLGLLCLLELEPLPPP